MAQEHLKSGLALNRIVQHGEKILSLCHGLDRESFLASPSIPDAVGMNLIAIGQWMMDIRDGDDSLFQTISGGNEVIGLRHILAHDYVRIDFSRVWGFVTDHIPQLVREASNQRDRYIDEHSVQLN